VVTSKCYRRFNLIRLYITNVSSSEKSFQHLFNFSESQIYDGSNISKFLHTQPKQFALENSKHTFTTKGEKNVTAISSSI